MISLLNRQIFSKESRRLIHSSTTVLFPKRWQEKSEPPFQSELTNPVAEVFGGAESWPEDEVFEFLSL